MQLSRILLIIGAMGVALGAGLYLGKSINHSVIDNGDKAKEVKAESRSVTVALPQSPSDRNLSSQPAIIDNGRTGSPTVGTGYPAVEEMAALRRELERLGAELTSLREELHQQNRDKALPKQAEGETAQDLPMEMESREEAEQHRQEMMQTVEAKYRGESVDPVWSNQAITIVGQALANDEIAGTAVRNMECRAQTCRVEVAFTDRKQLERFTMEFPQKVAQVTPSITVNQINEGDDRTTMILYLTRDGFEPY